MHNSFQYLLSPSKSWKIVKKCGREKQNKQSVEWEECVVLELDGGEGREKDKTDILEKGQAMRVFVNELVCMAGTTQWPQARNWHAIDTRLKLTLTPQIITFSLWKFALPSHSSHTLSCLPHLLVFLFFTAPHLLWYIGEEWCWLWKAITCHLSVSLSLW